MLRIASYALSHFGLLIAFHSGKALLQPPLLLLSCTEYRTTPSLMIGLFDSGLQAMSRSHGFHADVSSTFGLCMVFLQNLYTLHGITMFGMTMCRYLF